MSEFYCRSFFALLAAAGAGTSWNCVKVLLAGVRGAAWSSGVPCLGIDGSGYCPDRRAIRQQAGQSGTRCRIAAGSQADTSGQPGNAAEQHQRAGCRSSSSTDCRHSSRCRRRSACAANTTQHQRRNRGRISTRSHRAANAGDRGGHRQAGYRGSRSAGRPPTLRKRRLA